MLTKHLYGNLYKKNLNYHKSFGYFKNIINTILDLNKEGKIDSSDLSLLIEFSTAKYIEKEIEKQIEEYISTEIYNILRRTSISVR